MSHALRTIQFIALYGAIFVFENHRPMTDHMNSASIIYPFVEILGTSFHKHEPCIRHVVPELLLDLEVRLYTRKALLTILNR